MYKQIEITAFLELKLVVEKAKKICKDRIKTIFKNLRQQLLRRSLGRSKFNGIEDALLHINNVVAVSHPSGTSNSIHLFPDSTKNQRNSILEACLNRMPKIQRRAFVYKTFEGKKTSLICTDLDINEAVFWKLIQNARKELIESLDLN